VIAHIIYQNYLNKQKDALSIGGIQTYISNLSDVLLSIGFDVIIYQRSNEPFDVLYGRSRVIGIEYTKNDKGLYKALYNKMSGNIQNSDLLIFGDDSFIVKNTKCKTIAIQHGVFWDKPERVNCTKFIFGLDYILRSYRAWKTIKRLRLVDSVICVDHNFVNWYRAIVAYPQIKFNVIPNFSTIPGPYINKHDEEFINIIFARRLFDYRGTRIFATAIEKIIAQYENVFVTIAGEGPDEDYLKDKLLQYKRIEFIKYESKDSHKLHANKHIAVVPTLGSEGTSLSLLEAMASSCAVICSDVGGMTNIVLDHYNGLMIQPNENDLYNSIIELIENNNLRKFISKNAYDTVLASFSKDKWKNTWIECIKNLDYDVAE